MPVSHKVALVQLSYPSSFRVGAEDPKYTTSFPRQKGDILGNLSEDTSAFTPYPPLFRGEGSL